MDSGAFSMLPPPTGPASPEMEASVLAVERILNYSFEYKRLLEEALTHSSFPSSASYQRLEFVGDAALGLAFSNYLYRTYPQLHQGQLSLLRAANVSTEKLARVAIKHDLYRFVRRNARGLDDMVRKFADAVSQEDDTSFHGGSVKAPKVLADIVESVAAAIYVDVVFDLQKLWVIFRGLLEPIVTPNDLIKQPQPVTMFFELCQKQRIQADIQHWKRGSKNVASVYVNGKLVASSSSMHKEIAKLDAAKAAFYKLSQSMSPKTDVLETIEEINGSFEIGCAKQKLHELCTKKKWPKPNYKIQKDEGPPHDKKYMCSVEIAGVEGMLHMTGEEKKRVKDAENSAALLMICALREAKFL